MNRKSAAQNATGWPSASRAPDRPGRAEPQRRAEHAAGAVLGRVEDVREVEAPRRVEQQEHPQQEAEVAHAVRDERLLARVGVRLLAVPETDEQVAAEADSLPADEHHR